MSTPTRPGWWWRKTSSLSQMVWVYRSGDGLVYEWARNMRDVEDDGKWICEVQPPGARRFPVYVERGVVHVQPVAFAPLALAFVALWWLWPT